MTTVATYQFCKHLVQTKPAAPLPVPCDLFWECAELVNDNCKRIGAEIQMNPELSRPNLLVYGHWLFWSDAP